MKKRKRIRIKWKNIFGLLFTIFLIVGLFKIFFMYKDSQYNKKIYNDIKGENLTINLNKKYLKLNDSNLEYIKKTNVNVRINHGDISYMIKNNKLKNRTNINIKTYNEVLNKDGFKNNKALIISDEKLRDGNITIKLPKYLNKNRYVDVYAIKDGKYVKSQSKLKVKNEKVTFVKYRKYNKYAIVYVELKDIKIKQNYRLLNGRSSKIKMEFIPENATNTNYKFKNVNNKYISIENDEIKAVKVGTTSFNVMSYDGKIKKKVGVNILESDYKVTEKDGIYYVDGLVLVNKSYPINKDFDPKELLPAVKSAFEKMKKAAKADDVDLWIVSGYRSYDTQKIIYENYVTTNGKEKADTFSARPGFSEHQSGYAMDLNDATSNFEGTKAAKWLSKNCYKYGFIIRYPKGKEKYTGYKYEPWHVRYVGLTKAEKIHKSGLSIEEYYNVESKYKEE